MTWAEDEAKEFVLRTARENDVKFIRLWFCDILGALKGFAITVEELEDALEQGVAFDGSSIEGFVRIDESDMVARPDPTTFRILSWRPRQNSVARMFCDIHKPTGDPFEGDPRFVLKRNVRKASNLGFTYYVGPEFEYFYLTGTEDPKPIDKGGYFDQLSMELGTDLRRETVLTLAEMGIPVKYSHHEAAPGQHEIDLQYTDAITMADNVTTSQAGHKRGGLPEQRLRHLHAEAAARGERFGHARTPVPFPGGLQLLLRPEQSWRAVPDRQTVHGWPAAPRTGDHFGDQPMGELLQKVDARPRSAHVHIVGDEEPFRPDTCPLLQTWTPGLGAHRVPCA